MRLWKRAAGAVKDKYSIWVARLAPRGPCRNPDLETVIIKATSHDEQCMDYKNVQRVFRWLRTSPLYLKPILYTISKRMEKTHSWVVALKGLMLIHGVFCFDLPIVQRMGRLPFDFSCFSDGHMSPEKGWGFNAFVRAYFAYLDHKSIFICAKAKKLSRNGYDNGTKETLMEELQNLEKLQGLIDMLIQIKPWNQHMKVVLILEAMDCIMDEVIELYDTFCTEIDRLLVKIYDVGGKVEASIGLSIVEKAELQGDKLSLYFDFCRDIGVLNASECPKILRIPEKDINELRKIINGVPEKKILEGTKNDVKANMEKGISENNESDKGLRTVITEKWEVFDDDIVIDVKENPSNGESCDNVTTTNPFLESCSLVPYIVLPDLICL
ncbi:hypothetical protein TanjilG_22457 [Lupinus angustifolius]|uniref:ENTH domain-containing protein n=1 Tax=Lupinus angustifolius TaxID=3871 RepID=A0A4P1RT08_LUPAN|nr:PREDICTED: putative clathrin assembly protein At1g25240 [Lupinus angustifolius]OIW17345.1 hypothetical protein TanjilG_22457 [Lupinus angustifolius]